MRTIMLLAISVLLLAACSGVGESDKISHAELSIMEGDYTEAQDVCDNLLKNRPMNAFTVNELCRLSIVYMRLSENHNADDNVATAIQCYRTAMRLDPDSVVSYFMNVPIEDVQYEATLKSIAKSLDCPVGSIGCEIPDSVYMVNDSLRIDYEK